MTNSQRMPRLDLPTAWPLMLALIGLDYFSTLAYLPSIAVAAAGPLAPIAVALVVLVTFLLALPVYWYVAGRSTDGRGATGLIEQTLPGWRGKLLVLTLLGFAAADFVITRSLSVADAATHLIHNPHGQALLGRLSHDSQWLYQWCGEANAERLCAALTPQLLTTLGLSIVTFALWWVFRAGISRRMLQVCAVIVVAYLGLSGLVVVSGLRYVVDHPQLWRDWVYQVYPTSAESTNLPHLLHTGGKWLSIALWCFPQMALGLSGFELIMTVVPRVRGRRDQPDAVVGRVHNTRKLMLVAGTVLSIYLTSAVFVTTLLVPAPAVEPGGPAEHRSLAYLAHGGTITLGESASALCPWFSEQFGDFYDLATVAILCLAGASVMLGLRSLVPHYLHRLGMELSWAGRVSIIMHVLNAIILIVTLVFHASLSAQQWAYASSVLVLLAGASLAATWDVGTNWIGSRWRLPAVTLFGLACGFFLAMTVLTLVINHSGLVIASAFVAAIVITSFFSRWMRSTELRFEGFAFEEDDSRRRWQEIGQLPAKILVPHRPGMVSLPEKRAAVTCDFHLDPSTPIIFVQAALGDPSDFYQAPLVKIETEDGLEVIRLSKCVSVAHVMASVCLEMGRLGPPPIMVFGWSQESPLAANLNFLLLGEGNIPWMVKELVSRAVPDVQRQPRILIG